MKTIVIYNTQTGFTKQYAEYIAQKLGCLCWPMRGLYSQILEDYDLVIFGSWVMGGALNHLPRMHQLCRNRPMVVFGVGSTSESEGLDELLISHNHLENTPFFYFRGGLRLEQLPIHHRMMLRSVQKALARKKNPQPQEAEMAQLLQSSFDRVDLSLADALVKKVRELAGEEGIERTAPEAESAPHIEPGTSSEE